MCGGEGEKKEEGEKKTGNGNAIRSQGCTRRARIADQIMSFYFDDSENMETKIEEFNLLIKERDDISGIDDDLVTIKRTIIVARAPEPLRTDLRLNSHSRRDSASDKPASQSVKGFKRERNHRMMETPWMWKSENKRHTCTTSRAKGRAT